MNNRLLAFDYGTKRIGVATGNKVTDTTQALSTLSAKSGKPNWQALDDVVSEWRPGLFVVGLPLEMDGVEGEMCRQARKFGQRVSSRYGIPVEFIDERLTSIGADNLIRDIADGRNPNARQRAARDNLAAELILKAFLEQN